MCVCTHLASQVESSVRKSDSLQPQEATFDVLKLLDEKGNSLSLSHNLTIDSLLSLNDFFADEREREGQVRMKEKEKGKRPVKVVAQEEDDPFADIPDADVSTVTDAQVASTPSYDSMFESTTKRRHLCVWCLCSEFCA
jgi:hypothetical protein